MRSAAQLVTGIQNVDPESPSQLRDVKKGDRVILTYNPVEGAAITWMLGEYVRTDALAVFGLAFAAVLILFGRRKGVNTLLSLGFTCLAIFVVFIPAILSGKNIYGWSVAVCVFVIVMTLLIVEAPTRNACAQPSDASADSPSRGRSPCSATTFFSSPAWWTRTPCI